MESLNSDQKCIPIFTVVLMLFFMVEGEILASKNVRQLTKTLSIQYERAEE